MKELRCLVFTEQEVAKAVLDRRRRLREPLPRGTVGHVWHCELEDGLETTLQITADDGADQSLVLGETEVAAALVAYCMNRRVPLPVESEKMLYLINESLTLMITMNFNKPPRLIVAKTEGADGRKSRQRRAGRLTAVGP